MARSYHRSFLPVFALLVGCSGQHASVAIDAGGVGETGSSSGDQAAGSSGVVNTDSGTPTPAAGGSSGSGGSSSGGSGGASSGGSSSSSSNGGSTVLPDDGGRNQASDGGGTGDGGGLTPGTDGATAPYPGAIGDGDFMVGPTYTKSADLTSKGAPAGKSFHFTMNSTSSMLFTGMDSTLLAANQHSFTRGVDVYIPAKYKDGATAPFMVIQDGPGQLSNVKLALDNLTQSADPARQLPTFIAIAVANGGGDSIGSERGLEYDTVSDRYAQFVETEVLPAVLADATIKAAFPNLVLTADPDGRGTVGCSSGSAAALTMGWFHPEWFHRIVTYSGTFVDQQNPAAAEQAMYPLGAWDYHSDLALIANTAPKPLRVFVNANEMDNGATAPESGHHNWLLANQRTAAALKTQNYHYRFVEGLGAGHCDQRVQDLTMADTLLWVWQGYPLN
jgi:enterochelin esterase family protein